MDTTASTLDEVRSLIGETLGVMDRVGSLDASTGLLDSLPELDSLGVAELLAAIEERFGFEVDNADITIDMFETIGALVAYIDRNRPNTPAGFCDLGHGGAGSDAATV